MFQMYKIASCIFGAAILAACVSSQKSENKFAGDAAFLQTHSDAIILEDGNARAVVVPAWQGRLMTSTDDIQKGDSFGWINRKAIAEGILSAEAAKGTLKEHIHVFGGEERFWLSPEGGQFSLYFPAGAKFEFSQWKVPAALDTEPFNLVSRDKNSARFSRRISVENYSGTVFNILCERQVRLVRADELKNALKTDFNADKISFVAVKSSNKITNIGRSKWTKASGMPAIWMLGMFNVSDTCTIVVPYKTDKNNSAKAGIIDDYFGKIASDRLVKKCGVAFLKADGKSRGKIGVPSECAKSIAAAYDCASGVLTVLVALTKADCTKPYVNNLWEIQKNPYEGDAVSAYNDGVVDGSQMGPFFELETSSPALDLSPSQSYEYSQITAHIRGDERELDKVSRQLLGVGIKDIANVFNSR